MSSDGGEIFDLVVIGGGPAGYVAAIRGAQLGLKTACIEKWDTLGGTCLNVGCIPSKALLDSSEHFHFLKHKVSKHGIKVENLSFDLETMMKRKDSVVRPLTNGVAGLFKKNKITHVQGHGKFIGKSTNGLRLEVVPVKAGIPAQILEAKNVIIATGSEASPLPFLPFDEKRVLSSTGALSIPEVPKHLLVIGGGVIGLELGSVWARLGAKVTVIEFLDRLIPGMDKELGSDLLKILLKQGMEFSLETQCVGAEVGATGVRIQAKKKSDGTPLAFEGDYVLVSTGRRPYTNNLGLDAIGLKTDAKGRIEIDDHFKTAVPGVYAVGDVVRGPMLAHKAEDEGLAAAEIIAGQAGHVNYDAIPGVVYTWPEVAGVGATEEELKQKNTAYRVGKFPFLANGRAKAMDEIDGWVKILADERTDRVLGVHIIGPRASDLIAELTTVIEFGGSAEDVARTCHAHPTLSEVVKEAAMDVAKRKIHL